MIKLFYTNIYDRMPFMSVLRQNTDNQIDWYVANDDRIRFTQSLLELIPHNKYCAINNILMQSGMQLCVQNVFIRLFKTHADKEVRVVTPNDIVDHFKNNARIGNKNVAIGESIFKSAENLIFILDFCNSSDPSRNWQTNLNGSHLLLTADDTLQAFSITSPKYSYDNPSMFKNAGKLFLNKSCYPIFNRNISCLKQIKIDDLKMLLPYVFDDSKLFKAGFNATTSPKYNKYATEIFAIWQIINDQIIPSFTVKPHQAQPSKDWLIAQLTPILDYALVPVKLESYQNEQLLAPLSDYNEIISSKVGSDFKKLIWHLQLPVLDDKSPSACLSIVNRITVNEDDLIELLTFFQRCFVKYTDCFDKSKLNLLVEYIAGKIPHVDKNVRHTVASIMKSLPIYKNLFGDYDKIYDGHTVQAMSTNSMPKESIKEYCQAKRLLIIAQDAWNQRILQFLEIPMITPVGLYSNDFLSWIELVNKQHLQKHVQFIQSNWHYNEYKNDENLVNCLKACRFIPVQNDYKRANELYNPRLKAFQFQPGNFYGKNLFPPAEMQHTGWLGFLETIGLKKLTSAWEFVELANIISKMYADEKSKHDKITVFNTAVSKLVDHLQSLSNTPEILKAIRTIQFIPRISDANRINFKLYPISQKDLVCMENSTFECNASLVWCIKPILPTYCKAFEAHVESGIVSQVAMKDVVDNFRLFVERLKQRPDLLKTDDWPDLYKLVQAIYKHFMANAGQVELSQLNNTECLFHLFANKIRISKPMLFYIDLDENDEIDGHWYRMPIGLREYTKLFKQLGTTDTPTVQCCQTMLSHFGKLANQKTMEPNEIRAAFIAIRYMLRCLGRTTQVDNVATHTGPIHFPNQNGRMCPLDHLFYVDKPSQKVLLSKSDMLRNMCVFDYDELKIISETGKQTYWDDIFSGFEFFRRTTAPQPLSNIIIENILTDANDMPVESDTDLTDKFKRKEFAKSLIALMNKFLTSAYTDSDGKVEKLVNKLALHTKHSIRFNYKLKSSNKIIKNTGSEKDYLFIPSLANLNIYRKREDIEPYEYHQFIAETICDELISTVTDKDSKDRLKMNSIEIVKVIVKLITNDIDRFESILEKFDVRPIDLNSERVRSIMPAPGEIVATSHQELLRPIVDSVGLNHGKYVAYFEHNEYRYATVVTIGTDRQAAIDLKISKDQTKPVALEHVHGFYRC